MDFTLPEHLPGAACRDGCVHRGARSSRWKARTSSTSTSAESMPAPIGTTTASRRGSGRSCSPRCAGGPTRRAGCATGCRPRSAAATATNVDMAVIREHLAHKGLGLHNDLQNESSIVGNFPQVIMMERFGTDEQRRVWSEALITGERSMAFGLTEPQHGSDATWLETNAKQDGDDWVINGSKRFNTGVHRATHDLIFARTSGEPGQARGITAFLVPTDAPGFNVPYYWWTFNMPTDHGEVELTDVRVPADAVLGEVDRGLGGCANVLAREPNSPSGQQPGRGAILHRPGRRIRRQAYGVRQAAVGQPGRAMAAGRAAYRSPDGAAAGALRRLAPGSRPPHGGLRQGVDGELPRQPAGLRRRRPRHADLRRPRLQPP